MPCMPHFHDHFIPSTWVVLRKQDNPPAATAPAGPQPCCQHTETKLRAEFKQAIRGIIQTLLPFREAHDAVRTFIAQKAAEELQAQKKPAPQFA